MRGNEKYVKSLECSLFTRFGRHLSFPHKSKLEISQFSFFHQLLANSVWFLFTIVITTKCRRLRAHWLPEQLPSLSSGARSDTRRWKLSSACDMRDQIRSALRNAHRILPFSDSKAIGIMPSRRVWSIKQLRHERRPAGFLPINYYAINRSQEKRKIRNCFFFLGCAFHLCARVHSWVRPRL